MQYFFTSDEHYGHANVIKFCNRPFANVQEMDQALIDNHNAVVSNKDITVHVGDFTLTRNQKRVLEIQSALNGKHIYIKGSHDYWMEKHPCAITSWEKKIQGRYIVADHYAGHVWARSHYNSLHVFGHAHGNLDLPGKRWDVGVDNNNYFPVSFTQLIEIMDARADNFNYIPKDKRRR